MNDGPAATGDLEAERALLRESVRRQRILSEVSRILLDYVGEDELEPLRRVVAKVVEAMGDWCAFSLIQPGGTLKNVVTFHPDPHQRELAERFQQLMPPSRWDQEPAEHNALLQKRPIVFEHIPDELLRAGLPSVQAYELIREIGLTSVITAPMFMADEPLGTLVLASSGPGGRRYTENDIDFVFSLAGRAALAVRNARLLRALNHERNEAELRAAELLAVLRADPNGIAIFGTEGELRFASPSLDALFGHAFSQEIGKRFDQLGVKDGSQSDPGQRAARAAELRAIFEDRTRSSMHELVLEDTPRRYVMQSSTPVTGPGGAYLGRLFVNVDVTQERQLDQKRAEFLTVAAHELRTPLTPLSMYLQTIERKIARGQPVDVDVLGRARRQVNRLEKLVQDLLDVSRIDAGQVQLRREDVDLAELVEEVAGDFRPSARLHEIAVERPAEPVRVEADPERLEQVLVNLIANAIKYSPQGGKVRIAVAAKGDEALVSISDQGIGVPAEEKSSLFRRFFRARNAATSNYGGLGIGLYVSHEIVARHGGHFEVDSELGAGTTFRFFLPLAKAKRPAGRILLVDDDTDILEATAGFLQEEGYQVERAQDGMKALAALRRSPSPDLVLVDLMMPVIDGWELIARLRAERLVQGVPLVVFSADRDVRVKARELQVDGTLRKPFSLDELLELVQRLLAKKS